MNCVGVVRVARALGPGHTIVTILCDGGHRYLLSPAAATSAATASSAAAAASAVLLFLVLL